MNFYMILYTYFILSEDMKYNIAEILLKVALKTTWKQNKLAKTKNVSVMQMDYPS